MPAFPASGSVVDPELPSTTLMMRLPPASALPEADPDLMREEAAGSPEVVAGPAVGAADVEDGVCNLVLSQDDSNLGVFWVDRPTGRSGLLLWPLPHSHRQTPLGRFSGPVYRACSLQES